MAKNQKGMAFDTLVKWIIGVAVLIIVIIAISSQKDKILSLIQRMAEVLRFR